MFWSSLLKNLWIRLNHLKSNFHALATARDPRAFTRTVPLWLRSFGQTWESVLSVSVSFNCWRLNRCYLVSFHSHNAIGISNAAFQVHPPRDFSWVCIFPVGCCKLSSPSGRDQPDQLAWHRLFLVMAQTHDGSPKEMGYTCFKSHGPSLVVLRLYRLHDE